MYKIEINKFTKNFKIQTLSPAQKYLFFLTYKYKNPVSKITAKTNTIKIK